jgi:hypothetical protein
VRWWEYFLATFPVFEIRLLNSICDYTLLAKCALRHESILQHEEILCNFTHQYSRFLLREVVSEANHGHFVPYLVQAVGEEHALYRNDGEENAWPPYTSQIELAVMITFRYSPTVSFQSRNEPSSLKIARKFCVSPYSLPFCSPRFAASSTLKMSLVRRYPLSIPLVTCLALCYTDWSMLSAGDLRLQGGLRESGSDALASRAPSVQRQDESRKENDDDPCLTL